MNPLVANLLIAGALFVVGVAILWWWFASTPKQQ